MALHFAFKWNFADDSVTYEEVARLVKQALTALGAGALKGEIDNGLARVIAGPHKTTPGSSTSTSRHNHITVHCKLARVTYHLNVNWRSGGWTLGKVDSEYASSKKDPGHPNDDYNAPTYANSAALP